MRPHRPGLVDVIAAGLLPGALAGTQVAGLLFYLNPDLSFSPWPVLRAVLLYGSTLGMVSLALHLPWTLGRPRRARRALPWGITLALALAAVLDWTHASYYAYYLPPGINERLIKAALWLSLAALICFYTALLHTLHRRPYGRRSRWGYLVLSVLSIYVMVERREAFRPSPQPSRLPPAVEPSERPRLWVVGLDGATLDAILPLAGQGRLPFLSTVLQQGAAGRLESLTPHRREALWITLATGKYPYKHGVVGTLAYPAETLGEGARLRLLPAGMGFRRWGVFGRGPVRDVAPRESLALWEILPRVGVPSGLVGWPASSPAPSETVFALSERFFDAPDEAQSGSPDEVVARARLFRLAPQEALAAARPRFGTDPPPVVLESLAGDLWRESLTSALLTQHEDVAAMFLVLPGLEEVSRRTFGGYSAVQFEGLQTPAAQDQAELLAAYYGQLDQALRSLWNRDEGPKILAVVSPYGIEEPGGWSLIKDELRQRGSSEGRVDRSPDGILMLYGDGIRPGALLTGARVVDLAPTLLYGLGFPIARDFDGKVLTLAFERSFLASHPLTFLPSYEALVGPRSPGR